MTEHHIEIVEGDPRDYRALAHLHYREDRPATLCRVLTARHRDQTVGVLVVSRPTLNARWRNLLWPGQYAGADKLANAARLNADLRCISRVIVDPRARGLGVGTSLVRAYLNAPLTRRTEAVAAMGAACGIFRAAEMREVLLPPSPRDRTLRLALRRAGIAPWELLDPPRIADRARTIEHALRRWANDARATRARALAPLHELIERAARAVASPSAPRAYGHDSDHPARKD
ncbi:MAG: hypothetical protein KF699_04635 [Phycisphaeraceae bacterium]|nr:hypothetical protein [Phycisphaeraceae bacterium]